MSDLNKPDFRAGNSHTADPSAYMLVYATFPSLASAESAGGALVDSALAACVNILPGMVAIYRWQGKLHRDQEVVMIVKTRAALVDAVIAETLSAHPYDNPAILAVPVVAGASAYLNWILAQTAVPSRREDGSGSNTSKIGQ